MPAVLRKPQRGEFYTDDEAERAQILTKKSRNRDDRQAKLDIVMGGPLSERLIEAALDGPSELRHAALAFQEIAPSHIDYYLGRGKHWDKVLIVRNQVLDGPQIDAALSDTDEGVREHCAAVQTLSDEQIIELLRTETTNHVLRFAVTIHQRLPPEAIDLVISKGEPLELEQLAENQELTAAQVDALLASQKPEVVLKTVQNQPLTEEQVDRVLDNEVEVKVGFGVPAPRNRDMAREIRREAIRDATPAQLQAHVADADPVVAEQANKLLDAVVADLTADLDARLAADQQNPAAVLDQDDAWKQVSEREIQVDDDRKLDAAERDQRWWFDRAWQERKELVEVMGTRPEDPAAGLSQLKSHRDDVAIQLRTWENNAMTLPASHRHLVEKPIQVAREELRQAEERVQAEEQAIADGTHPQMAALAAWEAEHGAEAARVEQLTVECSTHLNELSTRVGSVPPAPTSELGQEVWLETHGGYAAMHARTERTGRTTEADVREMIELRQQAVERGSFYGRAGYDLAAEQGVDQRQFEAPHRDGPVRGF